jgi:hypothetical protein
MQVQTIEIESSGRRPALVKTGPVSLSQQYPHESRRWVVLLVPPVLLASAFIALAIATPYAWFFAGALLIGPFGVVAAIIYLSMSTDTNGYRGRAALSAVQTAAAITASAKARP